MDAPAANRVAGTPENPDIRQRGPLNPREKRCTVPAHWLKLSELCQQKVMRINVSIGKYSSQICRIVQAVLTNPVAPFCDHFLCLCDACRILRQQLVFQGGQEASPQCQANAERQLHACKLCQILTQAPIEMPAVQRVATFSTWNPRKHGSVQTCAHHVTHDNSDVHYEEDVSCLLPGSIHAAPQL